MHREITATLQRLRGDPDRYRAALSDVQECYREALGYAEAAAEGEGNGRVEES